MSEQFRAMMIQAHLDGERARRERLVAVFRAISRAQTYYKTAEDRHMINVSHLAHWMGVKPNEGPSGQRNFYSFVQLHEYSFNKLFIHGFLNWGRYRDGGWDIHVRHDETPGLIQFALTEQGSQFLKQCPTDEDIIRSMGLHK